MSVAPSIGSSDSGGDSDPDFLVDVDVLPMYDPLADFDDKRFSYHPSLSEVRHCWVDHGGRRL